MAHTLHTAAELKEQEWLIIKHANLPEISYEENQNKLNHSNKSRSSVFEADNIPELIQHLSKQSQRFIPTIYKMEML